MKFNAIFRKQLSTILVILLLSACGGGDNETDNEDEVRNPSQTDFTAPDVTVRFPSSNSATEADTVMVYGSVSDNESGVQSVSINGVAANIDTSTSEWVAEVPLVNGPNSLNIVATDLEGNINQLASSISVQKSSEPWLASVVDIKIDSQNNRYLVSDIARDALYEIDLLTGKRKLISESSDIAIGGLIDFDIDEENDRAFAVNLNTDDFNSQSILSIDLNSGKREVISDQRNSDYGLLIDLHYLNTTNSIFAYDAYNNDNARLAANIVNDISIYNVPLPYSRAAIINSQDFIYLTLENNDTLQINVVDNSFNEIFTQTVVLPENMSNLEQYNFAATTLDSENTSLIVSDTISGLVLSINLYSGLASVLYEEADHTAVFNLAIDQERDELILADSLSGNLYAVENFTNKKTVVSGNISVPNDIAPFTNFVHLVHDKVRDKYLGIDGGNFSIIAIDPSSGEREVLSENNGTIDYRSRSIAEVDIDYSRDQLIILTSPTNTPDRQSELISVDLTSGNQSIIANSTEHDLASYNLTFAFDETNDRLIFVSNNFDGNDYFYILERESLSETSRIDLPETWFDRNLIVNNDGNMAYFSNQSKDIISINLNDGTQERIFDGLDYGGTSTWSRLIFNDSTEKVLYLFKDGFVNIDLNTRDVDNIEFTNEATNTNMSSNLGIDIIFDNNRNRFVKEGSMITIIDAITGDNMILSN